MSNYPRIAFVVGTRPQFIKHAPLSQAIRRAGGMREVLIHTGQHYDDNMSMVFFRELGLTNPTVNLAVGSGSHAVQTARMLEAVEAAIIEAGPDWVVVYGDTNSTLAGALAASKLRVPLAHVEAGLRCHDRSSPEEVNRIVADHLSDIAFAPTESAVRNLAKEGIGSGRCINVGDVMYDAALFFAPIADESSTVLRELSLSPKRYILATVHRAENVDNPSRLEAIFSAFAELSKRIPVVVPLHPRTRASLDRSPRARATARSLQLVQPVGFFDMIVLERNAAIVVSDSGGVPKEAFFFQVPSVILRKEAVWDELVDMGWSVAVDPREPQPIVQAVDRIMGETLRSSGNPFGDGRSAERIIECLFRHS